MLSCVPYLKNMRNLDLSLKLTCPFYMMYISFINRIATHTDIHNYKTVHNRYILDWVVMKEDSTIILLS